MAYIISAVNIILSVIQFSVVIECVCSWLPEVTGTSFYEFLYRFNGSFLNPIRKIQSKILPNTPIDFSPVLLFLIIGFIRSNLW